MKKSTSKLRTLFTVYAGSGDKPIVQEWIGFRNGEDAYIGQNKYFRSRSKRVLRWHDGAKVFDTQEAALASLKPVKGWATEWRNRIIPALVVTVGEGKLLATDKNGNSRGRGYLTKRQAARAILRDAINEERRRRRDFRLAERTLASLRTILGAS